VPGKRPDILTDQNDNPNAIEVCDLTSLCFARAADRGHQNQGVLREEPVAAQIPLRNSFIKLTVLQPQNGQESKRAKEF
jgi:hypothetical protein